MLAEWRTDNTFDYWGNSNYQHKDSVGTEQHSKTLGSVCLNSYQCSNTAEDPLDQAFFTCVYRQEASQEGLHLYQISVD
ncbi:hypothetical protein AOXY_G1202 [Acipenser oxyrinchus oxyrinchus]|uniref:Uncharacterized protein n=1 Tax=Acipenser oxyrinchus oxyrinchus TaxID=40147 RepID=A0AAD8LV83_ACIOX|nr:hypothetical protein AOXY_G1202 [Acipenser oxyrinchus oxyrinchus]